MSDEVPSMTNSKGNRRKGNRKKSATKVRNVKLTSVHHKLLTDLQRELGDADIEVTRDDTVDNAADALILHVMRLLDEGTTIPKNFVQEVLRKSIELHERLPNVAVIHRAPGVHPGTRYEGGLTVVGDLHGQYRDFANIVRDPTLGGFPSPFNCIVFNGDLVDRGDDSVGIMIVVLLMKLFYWDSVNIIRGNHEDASLCCNFGFFAELDHKYPLAESDRCTRKQLKSQFTKLFRALPICAVIEDQIFLTHGGIGEQSCTMTIKQINLQDRFQDPEDGAVYELLWRGTVVVCFFVTNRRKNLGMYSCSIYILQNVLIFTMRCVMCMLYRSSRSPGANKCWLVHSSWIWS